MPKYADPAVFPVTAPAATDNVMTRTAAGTDGNFALGNLAGLAPLAVAADQSAYFTGTVWAPYTVTSAGRTLLAATTQAAQRTAVQAVGLSGDENIAGIKTFSSDMNVSKSSPAINLVNTAGSTYKAWVSGSTFYVTHVDTGINYLAIVQSTGITYFRGNNAPTDNNLYSSGLAANRWTTVYLVNAPNVSSDARLKTDPRELRQAEFKAASAIARLPAVWRWLSRVHGDENCEPEGKDARKHFGPTVQAAIAVMEANGLDPFAYSFICYDEWEALPEQWHEWPAQEALLDEDGNVLQPAVEAGRELVQEAREAGDRYSFRKEELLCFIVRALAQEIDGLSERVAALEAGRNP